MSHPHAMVAIVFSLAAFACGGAEPASSLPVDPPAPTDTNDATVEGDPSEPGSAFQFRIDGREGPMAAQARVTVQEGVPTVHLAITGGDDGDTMLVMDLSFDGIENTMGPHLVEFALPRQGDNVANASFDGAWYYSQGGEIDVRLSADGAIEGRFNVSLAPDDLEAAGEPPVFESTENATTVSGDFSGRWTLSCQSRLAGHSTLISGGEFCEELEF
jgi:hypothetical protein